MSMIGNLLRVSNIELESYIKNSALLEQRVYPEIYVKDPYLLDLDKSWESIFYLLTGCTSADSEKASPPLSFVIFNGNVIDEEQDMGYGPANYVSPEQAKEIAGALPELERESLYAKFESLKSADAELYPFNPDSGDMFDYIFSYYKEMKAFYETAAENGQAVISFIN
ncbi:YfbM family protein [Ferruginibacter sp.]